MKNGRVAIPSVGTGGLDGQRSAHFGHCDVFTIIDLKDGEITGVSVIPNQEHSNGGCLVPVNILASNKVTALIAGGMGRRPLMGFMDAGIDIYYDSDHTDNRSALNELVAGNLEKMTENMTCGGGHH
ncbi:MAG: NifB/NifX family molybdenum-iron cluster-binding protein [Spirochaetales bacterium]|nr:NifB/NifX family molybdenum-iron cluster-binding protein [Spirochaetales bacterium]